jgi:hypothetical protein
MFTVFIMTPRLVTNYKPDTILYLDRHNLFNFRICVSILVFVAFGTLNYALAAGTERQLFNIVDYGAKNDGSALATSAFQQAIMAAKAAGGGTIYVPPGKYSSGPIELRAL